jgi:chemotaxis protein histidine kinase CheA
MQGLGLFTVHNIVTQQLGGQIALSSAPSEGTTFRITLPMTIAGHERLLDIKMKRGRTAMRISNRARTAMGDDLGAARQRRGS